MNSKYEDTQIIISENKIEIKNYYFPTAESKIIDFSEIKNINQIALNFLNGRGRLWGMSLAPYWYNWDLRRFGSKKAIVIDLGKLVNPAITPENHEKVLKILQDKIKHG